MTYTIAGTYTTLVTLGAAIDNPTTITQTGLLTDGLQVTYQGLTVVNAGSITGSGKGVAFLTGGSITNQSGGTISGYYGIFSQVGGVTAVNAGSITGQSAGIYIDVDGSITNQSGGSISGNKYGIISEFGPLTIVNAGSIAGRYGLLLNGGGSVTNQTGGTISGRNGIYGARAPLTVLNAGVVIGDVDAVKLSSGFTSRLVIDPGAVFSGQVDGGNAIGAGKISTLELASGAASGTLSGLGTQFVDFAQITLDAGAQWTLTGGNTIASGATVTDSGILTDAGTVTNAGVFDGELTLAAGGVLSATGTVTMPGGTAVYGAAGGTATVANAGVIAGGSGFGNDGIDLAGGGIVTNQSGGTISGYNGIYSTPGTVTVVNAGSIGGPNLDGIYLRNGGSVTNQSGGAISGGADGVFGDYGAVALVNAGSITGSQNGVFLGVGGYVANQSGGTIGGTDDGIFGEVTTVTVVNAGSIKGSVDNGIYVRGGGSVTNQSGGTISGHDGIDGKLTDVTVVNAGSIAGSGGIGIYLAAGGNVTNQKSGGISGYFGMYAEGGAVNVVNAGGIAGNRAGIYLFADGSVTNQTGGVISGAGFGIYCNYSAVNVVNAGTIIGGVDAVRLSGGYTNRLLIDPGAVFSGGVLGGNAIGAAHVSTLELASASATGTLSGLGTKYIDFAQITVDAAAQWTLTGTDIIAAGATLTNAGTLTLSDATLSGAAALINNGAIVLDPSVMTIASLIGSGSVTIQAGSTLDVIGAITSTETIVFAGSGASLLLGTPASAAGSVTGFGAGDTIDLAGIAPASVSDAGGVVSFPGGSFSLAATTPPVIEPDGNGGTDTVACFAEGSRIATPDGLVAVEALQAGDRVLTASGDVRPVRWIGFRTIHPARHPAPGEVQPIRIAAGAFAEGVPSRDLLLSPDHAVLLHGLLIPIKLLRNDASITREFDCRAVTYYHVELDAHDIVLAERLEAESYLDTGNRAMFENAGLPLILHPDLTNDQARRERESCAPFADLPAVVEPIWRALVVRAEQMGLSMPPVPETTDDPGLHLRVDGRQCAPVSAAQGRYSFLVPGTASEVRLVSRHAVRPDTAPWIADRRRLGVQLRAMTIRRGGESLPVPLDHPLLADGWWNPEWHDATTLRRWTKGDAVVPVMAEGSGPVLLEVQVAATVPYPLLSDARAAGAGRVLSMAV